MSDYGQLAPDLRVEIRPSQAANECHLLTITNSQGVLVLIASAIEGRFLCATECLTKLYMSHSHRPVSKDELRAIMGWHKKAAVA